MSLGVLGMDLIVPYAVHMSTVRQGKRGLCQIVRSNQSRHFKLQERNKNSSTGTGFRAEPAGKARRMAIYELLCLETVARPLLFRQNVLDFVNSFLN